MAARSQILLLLILSTLINLCLSSSLTTSLSVPSTLDQQLATSKGATGPSQIAFPSFAPSPHNLEFGLPVDHNANDNTETSSNIGTHDASTLSKRDTQQSCFSGESNPLCYTVGYWSAYEAIAFFCVDHEGATIDSTGASGPTYYAQNYTYKVDPVSWAASIGAGTITVAVGAPTEDPLCARETQTWVLSYDWCLAGLKMVLDGCDVGEDTPKHGGQYLDACLEYEFAVLPCSDPSS